MKMLFSVALLLSTITQTVHAQKTRYASWDINIDVKPAYPQYKDYSTYDVAVINTMGKNSLTDNELNFNLPYEIHAGKLTKATANQDFHIVSTVYSFFASITSKSTVSLKVNMSTKLFDKHGNLAYSRGLTRDAFFINLGTQLTNEDQKNKDLVLRLVMQCTMDTLLQPFFNKMNGYTKKVTFSIAQLGDVKGKPELKELETQVTEIYKATYNKGIPEFKAVAEKYVPVWEKLAAYAGEGDVNEVKRAAYQNLATYYILTGDLQKAKEYIELYKPIDKTQSLAFGLAKYKESENLDKLIAELYPPRNEKPFDAGAPLISIESIVDAEKFVIIDGTIVLKGKKDAGSYTGKVKISKLSQEASGGIVNLDGPSGQVIVESKDEAGNNKRIIATYASIESIKADNGDLYTYKVMDATFGIAGVGVIMKNVYSSKAVMLYRTIFPEDRPGDYFILKTGDTEGLTKTAVKARKKMIEYFSDCPDLAEKLKNETISRDEKEEKIVELYTQCKQ